MNKNLSKYSFWILQILGWGAFSLFSAYVTKLANNTLGYVVHFLAIMTVGIAATTLLRYYFKFFVRLDRYTIWEFLKTIVGMGVITFLFPKFSYGLGYIVGRLLKLFVESPKEIFNAPSKEITTSNYVGIAIIIIGWTLLYFSLKILRRYNASRIRRLQLKDQVKQAQLNTLKGHINPNFVFTSLNKIKALMLEDVSGSRAMLTKLSELLRYSLTKNNINTVSLAEELEVVQNYVALLGIEYQERLQFSYEISPEALKLNIPPMMIINLLEMATKHGVLQTHKGGDVALKANVIDTAFQISLTHDGKSSTKKESIVLRNSLKQRLNLLFKGAASFRSTHQLNKTELSIQLPKLEEVL